MAFNTDQNAAGVKPGPKRRPIHSEVFEHKLFALLARLRTGTALRNLGRTKLSSDGRPKGRPDWFDARVY